jgi:hypothetical protein
VTRKLETPEEASARLAAQELTPREQAELWARLDASLAVPRWRRHAGVLVLACAGAAAAVALGIVLGSQEPASPVARSVRPVDACALDPAAQHLRLPASCEPTAVRVDGDEWLVTGGAELDRVQSGPRVVRGRVQFRVRPRVQAQLRVKVSHGEVRVIGTVFEIEQAVASGAVSVREGVIEFVWNDGARERVAAGGTLRWPRKVPELDRTLPAAADAGVKARRDGGAASAVDLEHVTARLLQLRSQKRHEEAVGLLRQTLAGPGLRVLQRERISYELGMELEASDASSCAHWRQHVARFGTSRHQAVLSERMARCRQP